MKRKRQPNGETRLIVATSETDADLLYATKFWAPDPFIFLEKNGKRTLVLSDLEIDRGRKQAKADEFVAYSQLERELQGRSKTSPSYEKVLAHFLRKRGVRSVIVPASFPLGYARELSANKIRLRPTNGSFWPDRERKTKDEAQKTRAAPFALRNSSFDQRALVYSTQTGRGELPINVRRGGGRPGNFPSRGSRRSF